MLLLPHSGNRLPGKRKSRVPFNVGGRGLVVAAI